MNTNLNGVAVRRTESTIFVKLPRLFWREIDGGCSCEFCKKVPGRKAYWDTMAVSREPEAGRADTTWTVHQPENHPVALRDEEIDREGTKVAASAA